MSNRSSVDFDLIEGFLSDNNNSVVPKASQSTDLHPFLWELYFFEEFCWLNFQSSRKAPNCVRRWRVYRLFKIANDISGVARFESELLLGYLLLPT